MVNVYRQECTAMRVRPISKLLEQLEVKWNPVDWKSCVYIVSMTSCLEY